MLKSKTEIELEKNINLNIKKLEQLGIKVRREKLTKGSGFRVRSGQCLIKTPSLTKTPQIAENSEYNENNPEENSKCLFIDKNLSQKAQLDLILDEYTKIANPS